MNARFSVVAIALMVFGIFMLVGFAPLGVALIIASFLVQSSHRNKALERRKGRRFAASEQRDRQREATMRAFR